MPPKNMISVMRKIHIPSVEASFCCSTVSNWTRSASESGWWAWAWLSNFHFLPDHLAVIVCGQPDDRRVFEIVQGRRRWCLPLQSVTAPRIRCRHFPIAQRPDEVNHRHDISDGKYGSSGGREHVEHLELVRIGVIAARHPEIAQDELREERQVESQENDQRGKPCPQFGIHPPGHLRPPV